MGQNLVIDSTHLDNEQTGVLLDMLDSFISFTGKEIVDVIFSMTSIIYPQTGMRHVPQEPSREIISLYSLRYWNLLNPYYDQAPKHETCGCLAFNSLWPSDAIRRQRSRSTLAQEMACCLTAPSHHLNQCLLIISEVQVTFILGQFHKRSLKHLSLKSVWKLHI